MSESSARDLPGAPDQTSGWPALRRNSGLRSARDWRHDHLEAVFERTRNAMLIVDNARVFVDCNQASGLLLDCPHEEIIGQRIDDFTPDEDHDLLTSVWPEFVSGNTGGEGTWVMCTAKSARITVEYSATPNFVPGLHLSILMKEEVEAPLSVPATTGGKSLSPREREILGRIAVGESGPRIAAELFISPATVRTHLQHVLVKLGAQTRPHAIALALQRGEITAAQFGRASSRPARRTITKATGDGGGAERGAHHRAAGHRRPTPMAAPTPRAPLAGIHLDERLQVADDRRHAGAGDRRQADRLGAATAREQEDGDHGGGDGDGE